MKNSFIVGAVLSFSMTSQSAIRPNKEYQLEKKIKPVVIAVIDTGLDVNHREFKSLLWENPGESGIDAKGRDKKSNSIDDDDNGFVDDVHGWNFVNNSNDLSDAMGHGTHIAGVIAKQSDKSVLSGIQNKKTNSAARLMVLKYYDSRFGDSKNIENTIKAFEYAIRMKAQIINYSGGGSLPSKAEYQTLKLAEALNIIVVAAAGNNKMNTDLSRYYPANYNLKNIISVAASDNEGDLVSFSNWGANTVDIAAPGSRIFSTLPNNKYGYMSGTSQATAYVTGKLSALISQNPKLTFIETIQRLIQSAEHRKNLFGKTKYQVALVGQDNKEM
jgi:subtilisin family serine protease